MTAFVFYVAFMAAVLLVFTIAAVPAESTEIGRRIADGLLARIFPPRDV